jgi:hypothetical protein
LREDFCGGGDASVRIEVSPLDEKVIYCLLTRKNDLFLTKDAELNDRPILFCPFVKSRDDVWLISEVKSAAEQWYTWLNEMFSSPASLTIVTHQHTLWPRRSFGSLHTSTSGYGIDQVIAKTSYQQDK